MKKKLLILSVVLFLNSTISSAQSLNTINQLAEAHQNCLDKGEDMQGCSKLFYLQMDSMLNLAYNNLRNTLSEKQKKLLKNEQLLWLKKRDKYFKEQEKEFQKKFNTGEWGPDMFMVVYSNDAEFVKQRVIILIEKRK